MYTTKSASVDQVRLSEAQSIWPLCGQPVTPEMFKRCKNKK
jgi:hypothetical protein